MIDYFFDYVFFMFALSIGVFGALIALFMLFVFALWIIDR